MATQKVYAQNTAQALQILVNRILLCLKAGGIPRMWLPGIRDDGYVGVDVVCVGKKDVVPTVRVLAPPEQYWISILQRMNETKGDWKWILEMAGVSPYELAGILTV